jgi:peptide/nickel transport system permease protein
LVLAGLAAPWIAPDDPTAVHLGARYAKLGPAHPLGTDDIGRDLLSRLLWGARWSLGGALGVTVVVVAIGLSVGAMSGYCGGVVDGVVMRVVDALLAFPALLLALAVVGVLGPGLRGLLLALVATGWAGYARVVRGLVLSLRERGYVEAARAAGARRGTIVVHHVLPNVLPTVVVLAALEIGQLILSLAALSFLGLGAQRPTPEWGAMLNDGRALLFTHPELMIYPGVAISLAVLGFSLLGDCLHGVLDPRAGAAAGGRDRSTPS